ncbi:hypothetical protein C6503_17655 [Candidatus Poribacteria bacterium]|nr:MAG: hypothetical protein C6503_17655 [Candidatus Poribacteria bacterium]
MSKKVFGFTFLLQLVLLTIVHANSVTVTENGDVVAETDRYLIEFKNGVPNYFYNKLTQETYTDDRIPDGTFQDDGKTAFFGFTEDSVFPLGHTPDIRRFSPTSIEMVYENENRLRMHLFIEIDPETIDLLIRQTGFAPKEGTLKIAWTCKNLSHDELEMIVPATGGVIVNSESPDYLAYEYPASWSAQLAIFQGNNGGFFVRSDDTQFRFKELEYERQANAFAVSFLTIAFAPFQSKSEMTSGTWRLNAYEGNWKVPALIYRNWMDTAFESVDRSQMPGWIDDIDFVVKNNGYLDIEILSQLNQHINPETTLIYVYQWHQDGVEAPYSTGDVNPDFPAFVEAAQRYGFKIMPHLAMFAIREAHPYYPRFEQYQARNPFTNRRMGWRWDDPTYPIRPAYINPASEDFRDMYVEEINLVWDMYDIEAIQFDISGLVINDNNGLVDGLTWAEGNIQLHKQIREAIPNIVVTGEHVSEVTFPYQDFVDFWTVQTDQPHPITTFLFSPYVRMFGFLPYPQEETRLYEEYFDEFVDFGFIPTLIVGDAEAFRGTGPDRERVQEILKFVRERQNYVFGDVNGDKVVNILDLVLVAQNLGEPRPELDVNKDEALNILDLVLVAQNL